MTGHGHHEHMAGTGGAALLIAALVLAAAGYLLLAARQRGSVRRGRGPGAWLRSDARRGGWSGWRTASLLTGLVLLAAALTGPVASLAATDFRGHMLQHLLIGMLAPTALVLAAPVTLLLRSLPPAHGRRLVALLRGRVLRLAADPWIALTLSVGGMAALYCTPLYDAVTAHAWAHHLMHLHFLLAGYLFAWVIAGPDPGPRRPSVPRRLVVLGVAVAVHATLSQLMYAGLLSGLHVPGGQLRGGAEIMYYGGDIAELLLAFALAATWRPARVPRTVTAREGGSPGGRGGPFAPKATGDTGP